MKKFLSIILVLFLIFSLSACNQAEQTETKQKTTGKTNSKVSSSEISVESIKAMPQTDPSLFEYEDIEGGISITNYTGQDEVVIIPEKIDGKTVLEIGEQCFCNNQIIKAVKLSKFVEKICDDSFLESRSLECFISGTNVKSIGEYAFYCCSKLSYVELNEGLESLAQGTFASCDFDSIYIPESVTELQYFYYLNEGEKFTVIGKAGSAAEQYAKDNNLEFKVKQ